MRGRFVRFSLFGLLGCILWVFILRDYAVFAEDLQAEAEDLGESVEEYYQEVEEIGSLSFNQEDLDSSGNVLSDSFTALSSLSGNRSFVYSFDSSKSWLFDENLYKWNYPTSNAYESYAFTFDAMYYGDSKATFGNTLDLVTEFYRYKKSQNSNFRLLVYPDVIVDGVSYNVLVVSTYQTSTATQNAIANNLINGFPQLSNNVEWGGYVGDPVTPTPTPTVTPTPTPDPDNPVVVGFEYMEQRPDLIVIIFALGVFIGLFAGTMVLRFVK